VGLGESGSEDVDGVVAKLCHLGVEARDLGGALVILARIAGAARALALEPTQFAQSMFEGSGVGEFADHLAPHPHVDADHRVALGNVGPLRASDTHPHGRDDPLSLARDRDPKDFGSIQGNEPFNASGVLMRA